MTTTDELRKEFENTLASPQLDRYFKDHADDVFFCIKDICGNYIGKENYLVALTVTPSQDIALEILAREKILKGIQVTERKLRYVLKRYELP
ncbi:MAG: hypothetical protein LBK63_09020 [Treponema sp.]|nr:hypothetical protein [Treponema sp.]